MATDMQPGDLLFDPLGDVTLVAGVGPEKSARRAVVIVGWRGVRLMKLDYDIRRVLAENVICRHVALDAKKLT